jgi:hypothetical protein
VILPQNEMQTNFSEEISQMNARPQVREVLIRKKLQRWCLIARYRFIESGYPRARARKNFWRLCERYPEIALKLGFNEGSVY